jgi:microcystin-dependent protein
MWVPYSFVPRGWAPCDGHLLNIASNSALFSLLGTQFGGNGSTTFALPDMRGRVPVHAGQGGGLSAYSVGQSGGAPTHTLTLSEMPAHRHGMSASNQPGTQTDPTNRVLGGAASGDLYSTSSDGTLAVGALATTGGGQAHNNMMPYNTLRCIIAVQGRFPVRP